MFTVLWLAVFSLSPAQACTCGGSSPPWRVLIPRSAAAFPTDGVVRVFLEGEWPEVMRESAAREYWLVDSRGVDVPLAIRREGTFITLAPREALQADADYALVQAVYYRDGELLDDAARLQLANVPQADDEPPLDLSTVERRRYPVLALHTAAGPERRRLVAPVPLEATLTVDHSSCGPGETLSVQLGLGEGLQPDDVIGVEVSGQGILTRTPWLHRGAASVIRVGHGACAIDPVHVDASSAVAVRVVAYGASERATVSAWTNAAVTDDFGHDPHWRAHGQPSPPPAWYAERLVQLAALPIAADERVPLPGPATCPFGVAAAAPASTFQPAAEIVPDWLRGLTRDPAFRPPRMARGAGAILVAWQRDDEGTWTLRDASTGRVIRDGPSSAPSADSTRERFGPVVWNGVRFLLVSWDHQTTRITPVEADGTVGDIVALPPAFGRPRGLARGHGRTAYYVGTAGTTLVATIGADGRPLGPPVPTDDGLWGSLVARGQNLFAAHMADGGCGVSVVDPATGASAQTVLDAAPPWGTCELGTASGALAVRQSAFPPGSPGGDVQQLACRTQPTVGPPRRLATVSRAP